MRTRINNRRNVPDQRGGTALIVTIMIVVLIGSVALVVDLGNLFRIRTELQTSADASALAGAPELNGKESGLHAARQLAMEYAAQNWADGSPVTLLTTDITFGIWNDEAREFTDLGSDPEDPRHVNAVKIITQRSAERDNSVELMFARIFGRNQADVSTHAIAVGGGDAVAQCPFPMVVSDCSLDDADPYGNCEYCMVFQNNNSDTAGWTSLNPTGVVGNPHLADLVVQACYVNGEVSLDENNECAGNLCNAAHMYDTIQVNNGNILNTGNNSCATGNVEQCNNPCPVIQDILMRDGTSPQSFVARVPVMESEPGTCSADQYSGQHRILGFAVIEIFGARCSSTDTAIVDTSFPHDDCVPPSSGDFIAAVLKCDAAGQGNSGGGFYGVPPEHFRLVE